MPSQYSLPGDFTKRPTIILQDFIEEHYNELESGVSKNIIRFNQWPRNQVEITLKCSSLVCHVNRGVDDDQPRDPFFKYFHYKEFVNVDLYQTSNSNELYPIQLEKIAKHIVSLVRKNKYALRSSHGIYEIYLDTIARPPDSRKNRFHIQLTVILKYTKTEVNFDESEEFPPLTGDEMISNSNESSNEMVDKILMEYIISKWPEDPQATVVFQGITPKTQVRFNQPYLGQGTVSLTVRSFEQKPQYHGTTNTLEFNHPKIILQVDVFSRLPSREDYYSNMYWEVRRFLEFILRKPKALRHKNIPLIEVTKIIERDEVELDNQKFKGNVFRIQFYVEFTFAIRVRQI